VLIKALRREGEEIDTPPEHTILYANDILVLQGKPRRVERVEHYLLDGIE
jgi:CPA2 family monovalent cation:H+ antiporter-2